MGSDNSPISELKATETEKQSAINTTIESTTNGTKKSGFVGNNKEGKAEETIPGWTIMRPLKRRAAKGSIDSNGSVDMKKGDTKGATATNDDGYGSGEGLEEVRSDDDLLEHEPGGRLGGNRSIEGVAPGGGSVAEGSFGEFKVYKRRWFGLIQLVLLNIIVSWDWLSFSASSTTVAEYYDVSESAINWLSTGFLFAFVVISPLTIHVLHHHGPKYAIVIASVLLLLGNWIRYGATKAGSHGNFGGVMFGQILTGLAQPFVLAAPTRYSDLWFTNRGRVAATAVASLANPFGGALAQLIDPFWANDPSDIPNMVLYIAIISSIATIPSFFIPPHPPTPVSYSGTQPKQALMPSLKFLSTSPEFYMIMIPYVIYVGLFNSLSSLINQILSPYSFTETDAGIAGALLIVVGLVTSAITSPIIDRTKSFLLAIKIQVPIIAICYLAFLWAPGTRSIAAPYVVLSILGAASFSLVPVVLEYLIEITHPVSPEVSSTICWSGGQLMGAIFIVISDALKDPGESDGTADDGTSRPPGNMYRALIFQAVLACVVVPLPLALGLFGRSKKVSMRRVEADREIAARRDAEGGGRGSTVLS